jgi:DNA-binding transcriptional MerR regulator
MPPKLRVQKRLYYKIGEACKLLDIQPYVLRYWETEFPALSPAKSRSGQRVYNEKELAIIRRIKELLYDEGYTIAGAKKKLEGELAAGLVEREDADEGEEREEPAAPEPEAEEPHLATSETYAAEPAADAAQAQLRLAAAPPPPLDTREDERVETLRAGIERALRGAREILALLDSKPPVK